MCHLSLGRWFSRIRPFQYQLLENDVNNNDLLYFTIRAWAAQSSLFLSVRRCVILVMRRRGLFKVGRVGGLKVESILCSVRWWWWDAFQLIRLLRFLAQIEANCSIWLMLLNGGFKSYQIITGDEWKLIVFFYVTIFFDKVKFLRWGWVSN